MPASPSLDSLFKRIFAVSPRFCCCCCCFCLFLPFPLTSPRACRARFSKFPVTGVSDTESCLVFAVFAFQFTIKVSSILNTDKMNENQLTNQNWLVLCHYLELRYYSTAFGFLARSGEWEWVERLGTANGQRPVSWVWGCCCYFSLFERLSPYYEINGTNGSSEPNRGKWR